MMSPSQQYLVDSIDNAPDDELEKRIMHVANRQRIKRDEVLRLYANAKGKQAHNSLLVRIEKARGRWTV